MKRLISMLEIDDVKAMIRELQNQGLETDIFNYYCKSASYCSLQTLFRGIAANFYTHGIHGWNFDAYTRGNKCVTTGYRNMIGESIPYDVCKKYEDAAEKIWSYENKATYDEKRKAADELLEKFWNEVF